MLRSFASDINTFSPALNTRHDPLIRGRCTVHLSKIVVRYADSRRAYQREPVS
jgi:hypothetical protein